MYYSHGQTNSCGVLIAIYGNSNICLKNKVHDNHGRVLILDATISGSDYLLRNFYNANTEREKLTTIKILNILLKDFEENLNMCDIWRVHNPHKKLFAFLQKHFTCIIQRRLDYIFISNSLQESVKKKEILKALLSDHSPVFCSFVNNDTFARGSGVWKFNDSLLLNTVFFKKLKTHIQIVKSIFQENSSFSDRSK